MKRLSPRGVVRSTPASLQLGSTWRDDLVPLLKDGFGGESESVEERVVTASLRAVPAAMRAAVEVLFTIIAVFAEDAIVPDVAIDAVAPLMQPGVEAVEGRSAANQRRQVRRCLQHLIKANLLRGSAEAGISVHDVGIPKVTNRLS